MFRLAGARAAYFLAGVAIDEGQLDRDAALFGCFFLKHSSCMKSSALRHVVFNVIGSSLLVLLLSACGGEGDADAGNGTGSQTSAQGLDTGGFSGSVPAAPPPIPTVPLDTETPVRGPSPALRLPDATLSTEENIDQPAVAPVVSVEELAQAKKRSLGRLRF